MMQTLRNNMKYILGIVLIAFIATIIFSWGMGGFKDKGSKAQQGIIGVVNDQKILYKNFAMALDQEIQSTQDKSPNMEITEYQLENIRNRIWENTIQEILIAQAIKKHNIRLSEKEIFNYMRYSPPDFVQSMEVFQSDGKFDMSKYQEAFRDPSNYTSDLWIYLENYYRNMLPRAKFEQGLITTVRVTQSELKEYYLLKNDRINVQYLFFNPTQKSLENINITEKSLLDYYRQHQEDYSIPEKRKIEYIMIEMKPSYEDTIQTKSDIEYLLAQIQEGGEFSELAKEYSEDPGTAEKGGDLGFIERGTMVKPFEEAAFSARPGEVVGPIKTQFGYHLIQVVARKRERGKNGIKVHAQHILLKIKISPETRDLLYDKAEFFSKEVRELGLNSFQEIAKQEKLTVKETQPFQEGGFIPGLGVAMRVNRFTFSNDINWLSSPIYANQNLIVFRITDIEKEHISPFEEVKSSIQSILENEALKKKTKLHCQRVYEKINAGTSLENAAIADSLQIEKTGLFSLNSAIPRIGSDPAFIGAATKLELEEISAPVEGERGYYLVQLIERNDYSEENFQIQKESLKKELQQQKTNAIYSAWYEQLKKEAKIEDYRNYFY